MTPIKYCFIRDPDSQNERGPHKGTLQLEERDDQEATALVQALQEVEKHDEIQIVNMSVGYKDRPKGLDEIIHRIAPKKILIASAGLSFRNRFFVTLPKEFCNIQFYSRILKFPT